ncbi:MAG: ABC transporter substrate-binding protein [Actinomycetota bacterium]|nr:ABC transporter substrate-binding protein [Actinomycetota bacterium]
MAATVAALCAGTVGQPAASAAVKAQHVSKASKSPKVATGAMPSFALVIGDVFTWILPLDSQLGYEGWDIFAEREMWLPLYWVGNGSKTGIDYAQSVGDPPVYSNHDKTVTITMKTNFKWSTGATVTSKDVKFYFQLVDAGKKKLGNYLPGLLPTDITSVTYPSASTVVLHLNRSYNPTWFTGNQLTWIYPLPVQEWDRTSLTSPDGTAASTPVGAKKVLTFLFAQSKDEGTWPTNPLWKTVDGPFEISAYDRASHQATLAANPHYTGPTKPRIAGFKLSSFTTGTAELDALRSGTITFGYIPLGDLKEVSYFKSHGYAIKRWPVFYNEAIELNYTSKTWGPLVKQLYIRQALQHLITEKLYIKQAFGGYALPDYGPVADYPGSKFVSPGIKKDPYPYDPKAAAQLLKAHGWVSGPGGVDVCKRPGTGPSDCGKGIAKGKDLSFKFMYETGTTAFFAEVSSFRTGAEKAGVGITLDGQPETTMVSIAGVCPSSPPCNWGLAGYSGWMWTYGQYQTVPNGTSQWGKGNFWGGGYYTPKAQKLIDAVETKPGLKPLYAAENYLSKNLASLWWPLQAYEVVAVKKTLSGWQHLDPYGAFVPQTWYLKKSG